jgi:SAM-dependent methyltransferase
MKQPRTQASSIEWGWDSVAYIPSWHEAIFAVMARYIGNGSRVLEIGAGGSHTLAALSARVYCAAFGLEPNQNGIAAALKFADIEKGAVNLVRGDGFAVPFADGEFDIVYSLGLIEHFSTPECRRLVLEHKRVCKLNGYVVISVPNLINLPHTIRKLIQRNGYPYYPERSFTSGQLCRLLEDLGLRIAAVDGLLPLWGLRMIPGAWRAFVVLDKLPAIEAWLSNLNSASARSLIGYMTVAVAQCVS